MSLIAFGFSASFFYTKWHPKSFSSKKIFLVLVTKKVNKFDRSSRGWMISLFCFLQSKNILVSIPHTSERVPSILSSNLLVIFSNHILWTFPKCFDHSGAGSLEKWAWYSFSIGLRKWWFVHHMAKWVRQQKKFDDCLLRNQVRGHP